MIDKIKTKLEMKTGIVESISFLTYIAIIGWCWNRICPTFFPTIPAPWSHINFLDLYCLLYSARFLRNIVLRDKLF